MVACILLQEIWSGFVQGLPRSESVKLTAVRLGKSFSEYTKTTDYGIGYATCRWLCNDLAVPAWWTICT